MSAGAALHKRVGFLRCTVSLCVAEKYKTSREFGSFKLSASAFVETF